MPIEYIKGDLLESDCDVILHGCNAVGGFGSGIAGQIAKKWPEVKQQYLDIHKSRGHKLGQIQVCITPDVLSPNVINCITQQNYLPRGILHADYDAIEICLIKVKNYVSPKLKIGLPLIGCGLAGGSWPVVEAIINKVFDDRTVYVYTID